MLTVSAIVREWIDELESAANQVRLNAKRDPRRADAYAQTDQVLRTAISILEAVVDVPTAKRADQRLTAEVGALGPAWGGHILDDVRQRLDTHVINRFRPDPDADPRTNAVNLLRLRIPEDQKDRLRREMTDERRAPGLDHAGIGLAVRNILRREGYDEVALGAASLDDVWAELLHEALADEGSVQGESQRSGSVPRGEPELQIVFAEFVVETYVVEQDTPEVLDSLHLSRDSESAFREAVAYCLFPYWLMATRGFPDEETWLPDALTAALSKIPGAASRSHLSGRLAAYAELIGGDVELGGLTRTAARNIKGEDVQNIAILFELEQHFLAVMEVWEGGRRLGELFSLLKALGPQEWQRAVREAFDEAGNQKE